MRVGKSQIEKAKTVNLIEYLIKYHDDLIDEDKNCRNRFVHPVHDSLVILPGGFVQHSNRDNRGDQIQYLMNYCNLSFQDAVLELCEHADEPDIQIEKGAYDYSDDRVRNFKEPNRLNEPYARVWAYLTKKRKFPAERVEDLFERNLLYQDADYGNAVFLSADCDYAEIVGTSDIKFRRTAKDSDPDGYWIYDDYNSDTVYVCESAIDAVSLMLLMEEYNPSVKAAYASISGLKDKAIERLKKKYKTVILAVDNDDKADVFKEKHKDLKKIQPAKMMVGKLSLVKDWNDMLRYCEDEGCIKKSLTTFIYDEENLPF